MDFGYDNDMRKVRILTIFTTFFTIFSGFVSSAPSASALLTLTNGTSIGTSNAGLYAIPSGVSAVYVIAQGGAGGLGGQDCGYGCNSAKGGAAGIVTGVISFSSGDTALGVYPGGAGGTGTTSASGSGGGSAGAATLSGYGGGTGGNAGSQGSSGGGGGGGAATVITKNNTTSIVAIAAGAGGGGGSCNGSTCYKDGDSTFLTTGQGTGGSTSSGTTGANGVPTISTSSSGQCSASNDGGGGGGGGGGSQGGGGGGLYVNGSECGGYAGYRGSNGTSGLASVASNSTTSAGITAAGYAQVYFLTLTPASSSKSVAWGTTDTDQISVTGGAGTCSSATISPTVTGITLTNTSTCTPTINIGRGAGNMVSTTSYTETVTVTGSYGEVTSTTVTITITASDTVCSPTTSTTGGVTIDTFTYSSGSYLQCGISLPATTMQYLVVGSGGGGGMRGGGGGGGGVASGIETITAGSYEIRVSQGGAGATSNCGFGGNGDWSWIADSNNQQMVTAGGGGGGGGLCAGYLNGQDGITPHGGSWDSVGGNGGGAGANYFDNTTNRIGTGGAAGTGQGANNSGYVRTSYSGGDSYNCSYGTFSAAHPNNLYRITAGGAGAGGSGNDKGHASNFSGCDSSPNLGFIPYGGSGVSNSISGGPSYYGAGGGGSDGRLSIECSSYHAKGRGTGGSGVGGNGLGFCDANGNSITKLPATNGAANTGSGGGGGIDGVYGDVSGSGAAGIVIIRFITAAPVISSVQCDTRTALFSNFIETTTAGVTDTFTVATGSIANSVLTRTYQWQQSTDGGTTWTNISGATGSSYSRSATLGANGFKYRVVVTDTDSESGLSLTSTSSAITSYVNSAITFSSPTNLSYKYGAAGVVTQTATASNGTGAIKFTYTFSTAARSGTTTFDTVTSNTLKETITSSAFFPGTYVETITATDSVTASTFETLTITVSLGDTVTVTAGSPSAITYSPTMTVPANSFSSSGLVGADTVTVTYAYSAPSPTCANGGTCSLGDTGPGGGKVFYISGSTYYEAAPKTWYSTVTYNGSTYANQNVPFCATAANQVINPYNPPDTSTPSSGWGGGLANTSKFSPYCAGGAIGLAKSYVGGGKTDWYVPDAGELDAIATYFDSNGGYSAEFPTPTSPFYWSSSATYVGSPYIWIVTQSYLNNGSWAGGAGAYNSTGGGTIIPIRQFTATNLGGVVSGGLPISAGTFTITPTATFTTGSASNYVAVNYVTGSLTINKAAQALLRVNNLNTLAFDQIANVAYSLSAVGGSDTGTVTFNVSNGTGTTCTMPTATSVLSTAVGTCKVSVTKAATINYLSATSDTATVSFILFLVPYSPAAAPGSGTISLPYTPPTPSIDPDQVPTFTYANYSAQKNTTLTISGSGFTGINEVDFDSGEVVMVTPTNNTTISFTVPSTAQSGPLILVKTRSNGSQLFARTDFTLLP